MAEVAAPMKGGVAFRLDHNYELGDFFGAAKGRHGDWLSKAAAPATAWNNEPPNDRRAHRKKLDFFPADEARKHSLDVFSCSNADCESGIYVVGKPRHEESLKGNCGR